MRNEPFHVEKTMIHGIHPNTDVHGLYHVLTAETVTNLIQKNRNDFQKTSPLPVIKTPAIIDSQKGGSSVFCGARTARGQSSYLFAENISYQCPFLPNGLVRGLDTQCTRVRFSDA